MIIYKRVFILRLLVIPILICLFSSGCIGNFFTRKSKEISLQNQKISELENEKAELSNEIQILKQKDEETNRIKSIADNEFSGTAITVRVKKDGLVSLTLSSSKYFSPGKAEIKDEAKKNLKKISSLINKQFSDKIVRVEGHTDNQPIKKKKNLYQSNWDLSAARALSVLNYFINECGVNPENIYVAGFAEFEPIADNSSGSGRDMNRRVEIVIIP